MNPITQKLNQIQIKADSRNAQRFDFTRYSSCNEIVLHNIPIEKSIDALLEHYHSDIRNCWYDLQVNESGKLEFTEANFELYEDLHIYIQLKRDETYFKLQFRKTNAQQVESLALKLESIKEVNLLK